jgi:SAM-dependent methyltransferase
MRIYHLRTFAEFNKFKDATKTSYTRHLREIEGTRPKTDIPFSVNGFSYTAGECVDFECDFRWGSGFPFVNWRERVVCPKTKLNNRMRASIHVADMLLDIYDDSSIFLMEQTTPLYKYYHERYTGAIGSEYLGSAVPKGAIDPRGIRNEDATSLTFEDASIDIILSFDVFEHIPNFKAAFSECFRVLSKNGRMLFSVPFAENSEENITRAVVQDDGSIQHLLPAEYHGDPVGTGGILCYHNYGWEMLNILLDIGFSDAYAITFWSKEMGYYTRQYQFVAEKRAFT